MKVKRHWKIVLPLIGLVAAGLLLEISLRLAGVMTMQTNVKPDRDLGWYDEPAPVRPEVSPVGPSYPHRGREVPILILGDSFIAPRMGVVSKIQAELDRRGFAASVINAGVTGYGTVQERDMWRRVGPRIQPKFVILAFFAWNDFSDNLGEIFYSPYANTNRPTADYHNGRLIERPQSLFAYMRTRGAVHSALVRWLTLKWAQLQKGRLFYWTDPDRWGPIYVGGQDERVKRLDQVTFHLLRQLHTETEAQGARLLVVGFDNAFTAGAPHAAKMRSEYEFFQYLDVDLPMKKLRSMTRHLDVPFLNLTDVFRAQLRQNPREPLYDPPLDGHFTARGEQIAAQAIARFVVDQRRARTRQRR